MRKLPSWAQRTIKACVTLTLALAILTGAGIHMSKDAPERARNQLKNYRPDQAVSTLKGVAWFMFWDADYHELRAQAHMDMGQYQEAADSLSLGIALAPERAKLYAMRAEAYQYLGMMDKGKVAEIELKRYASLPAYARNAFGGQNGAGRGNARRMRAEIEEPVYTPTQTELMARQEAAIELDIDKVRRPLRNPEATWLRNLERDLARDGLGTSNHNAFTEQQARRNAKPARIIPAVNRTPKRRAVAPDAG